MVSTSGSTLVHTDAVQAYLKHLLPVTYVLTPNLLEAKKLLEASGEAVPEIKNYSEVHTLAQGLHRLGPKWIVLKGGHLPLNDDMSIAAAPSERKITVDLIYDGTRFTQIRSRYSDSSSTHGTGCSLACKMC